MNENQSIVYVTVNVYVNGKLATQPSDGGIDPVRMPKDASITAPAKQKEKQEEEK